MNSKELDNLITFKMGIPSLYHIMLGMSNDETEDYQKELDNRNTDNYDLNDFLNKYEVMVERTAFDSACRIHELMIAIPIEHIKENEIQLLYKYFSNRMNIIEKECNVTSDANDNIKELNITIRSELYDVTFRIAEYDNGRRLETIIVSNEEEQIKMLACLAIIANYEKDFADKLFEYVQQYQNFK